MLPFILGGALGVVTGVVTGVVLKKYYDENQSDIFERIENSNMNLIDSMDFSKLDSLKQSVYNGVFTSFANYFNSLDQNELEKFDIKDLEDFSTIGVSAQLLAYEDNQNQVKIDRTTSSLADLNSSLISMFDILQQDIGIDFKSLSQETRMFVKEAYYMAKEIENICLSDMVN